jgi:hypothetical protein
MAKPNTSEALACMNCGAPIKSGFFCAKCQSGETEEVKKEDGWRGSRFTGEAKKRRKRQLLMEDLARWGKTLLILAIIGGVLYGAYALFGDQIKAKINQARNVAEPQAKYDPTKDRTLQEDLAATDGKPTANGKQTTGKRPFTRAGTGSIDGGPD